jgi:hypothetical protein
MLRTVSWILLALVGALTLLAAIVSANLAYSGQEFPIGGIPVADVAAGRDGLELALRGMRGTAAAYAAAFAACFLSVVVLPYRRGERWAWWVLLASLIVLVAVTGARVPALGVWPGVGASLVQGGIGLLALLLDVGRLRGVRTS